MEFETALISTEQMYRTDALAIENGIESIELMESAGRAVADHVQSKWPKGSVCVLCGPGNNGGDGFVAARFLARTGWSVQVYLLGSFESLKGDARYHAELWQEYPASDVKDILDFDPDTGSLVIDAVFGAGLTRPVTGRLATVFRQINDRHCTVIAVDLPSGINGDTGDVLGVGMQASSTVTFFRRKYGHVLYPGTLYCGRISVADIGIPDSVASMVNITVHENSPELWNGIFPVPSVAGHKYDRGHAVVFGGAKMTGAARLAARAARRTGAGLSSIVTASVSFTVYATADPGTIVEPMDSVEEYKEILSDPRKNAVLIGPGAGVSEFTRELTLATLELQKPTVLDADSLSVFCDDWRMLANAVVGPCVLTPHEGEFARLFGFSGDKISKTCRAARETGSVVLLKGPDTVIADPSGNVVINTNAVPDLATAGAGDVLGGIIVAFMAQGLPAFDAAAVGTWIHGAAAASIGPGLIAEDLCECLPQVVSQLRG